MIDLVRYLFVCVLFAWTFTVAVPAGPSEILMLGAAGVAPAPTASGGGVQADVVFEGLTTRFRRASTAADPALPQEHYEPCDVPGPGRPRPRLTH